MRIPSFVLSLLLITSLIGAPPSANIVMSCLMGEAITPKIKIKGLDTTDVVIDDNYSKGYSATLFNDHGVFGSATKGESFAVIFRDKLYPINSAISILGTKVKASPFSPTLAEWFEITEGTNRYFCMSSNFDGLGRSGRNQYVKFGYFLPINHLKESVSSRLYFAIADTSSRESKSGKKETAQHKFMLYPPSTRTPLAGPLSRISQCPTWSCPLDSGE